ncbi:unnamed protein product [Phaeothamnion confervicola]
MGAHLAPTEKGAAPAADILLERIPGETSREQESCGSRETTVLTPLAVLSLGHLKEGSDSADTAAAWPSGCPSIDSTKSAGPADTGEPGVGGGDAVEKEPFVGCCGQDALAEPAAGWRASCRPPADMVESGQARLVGRMTAAPAVLVASEPTTPPRRGSGSDASTAGSCSSADLGAIAAAAALAAGSGDNGGGNDDSGLYLDAEPRALRLGGVGSEGTLSEAVTAAADVHSVFATVASACAAGAPAAPLAVTSFYHEAHTACVDRFGADGHVGPTYRAPSRRAAAAAGPGFQPGHAEDICRPNGDEALRRVAIVLHQHITSFERRHRLWRAFTQGWEPAAAEAEGEGLLFSRARVEAFSEEHYVAPTRRVGVHAVPVSGLGLAGLYFRAETGPRPRRPAPSPREIYRFARALFRSARLSSECSIVALIYVEKLVGLGRVPLLARNWRPVLLAALLCASKVWMDYASWNVEFTGIYRDFTLAKINQLERDFVQAIGWDLYVASSVYAKYYFALRSLTENRALRRLAESMQSSRRSGGAGGGSGDAKADAVATAAAASAAAAGVTGAARAVAVAEPVGMAAAAVAAGVGGAGAAAVAGAAAAGGAGVTPAAAAAVPVAPGPKMLLSRSL